jgi:hypothetical protein
MFCHINAGAGYKKSHSRNSKARIPDFCAMQSETGKWIILIGIITVCIGVIIYFFHDKLHWIGRLPGDIRIEKENFRLYIPITTMILASILFTLILRLVRWILKT